MKPEQIAKISESSQQRALFAAINGLLWQRKCQAAHGIYVARNYVSAEFPDLDPSPLSYEIALKWDGSDYRKYGPLEWCHAIPNGGSRGNDARSRAIAGATMKAEGVKSGIPDVFLPYPKKIASQSFSGVYIEMKKASGGRLSEEQSAFGDYARRVGYVWRVCYTWDEALSVLTTYLEA